MSLHTAKAHFSNAHNYAKSEFEKQLAQGLTALVAGLSTHHKETEERLRTLEKSIQQLKR